MGKIKFFQEDIKFSVLGKTNIKRWIYDCILEENAGLEELKIILCSDAYLQKLNIRFLNRQSLTDIITFSFSEKQGKINGELYISIERIKENAFTYEQKTELELKRVIIHGVLHLLGYDDRTKSMKEKMKSMENYWLSKLNTTQNGVVPRETLPKNSGKN